MTIIAKFENLVYTVSFSSTLDPFSEGEQRISFHGSKISSYSNENIVLKEFKHDGRGMDRREDYIEIMETQVTAAFMAKQFNKVSPRGSKEVHFLHVSKHFCKILQGKELLPQ